MAASSLRPSLEQRRVDVMEGKEFVQWMFHSRRKWRLSLPYWAVFEGMC